MCCPPGAKTRDIAKQVPQLVKSTGYYPLLLFHVGINDTSTWNPCRIKEDYKALEKQVKDIGAPVILSSVLPTGCKGAARNRSIMRINYWVCGWCHYEGFSFYDNGTFSDNYNL